MPFQFCTYLFEWVSCIKQAMISLQGMAEKGFWSHLNLLRNFLHFQSTAKIPHFLCYCLQVGFYFSFTHYYYYYMIHLAITHFYFLSISLLLIGVNHLIELRIRTKSFFTSICHVRLPVLFHSLAAPALCIVSLRFGSLSQTYGSS